MARRLRIGVPFNYDENWIGGVYYVKNLIASLNLIEDSKKPDITLLSHQKSSYDYIVENTSYPHLSWCEPAMLAGADQINFGRRKKLLARLVPGVFKSKTKFDLIFPYPMSPEWDNTACWIPDFQDKHMPHLFTTEELASREVQHRDYFTNYAHLVLSSRDAEKDFRTFYPDAEVQTHVIHFAVFEPLPEPGGVAQVLQKYNLPETFFYCPNQFWVHKNHSLVIDAIALLREQGTPVTVAFSGKEFDSRDPELVPKLKARAADAGVTEDVRFLGFLPRADQMAIFHAAHCVIQPSLFEGWSTVIEDAQSVSKYTLAADLAVNIEQADRNIEFFDRTSPAALAELLLKYRETPPPAETLDYTPRRQAFADGIMALAKIVSGTGN